MSLSIMPTLMVAPSDVQPTTMPSLYVKIFNKQTQTFHEAPRELVSKVATWEIHLDRWSDDGNSITFYGSQDLLTAVLEVAQYGSTNYTNHFILSAKLKELGFMAPVTYKCYYQFLDGSYNLMTLEKDKWIINALVLDAKIVCKITIKIRSFITYSYRGDNGITNCEYKIETKKYNYTETKWNPINGEEYKIIIESTSPYGMRVETVRLPEVKEIIKPEVKPNDDSSPWNQYYHQYLPSMFND
jgi:hypothetical protein